MLGFLSVSTPRNCRRFSESVFQSRAGFSECLDGRTPIEGAAPEIGFNPVLGFLSVSTTASIRITRTNSSFNPVLGFLSVSTAGDFCTHCAGDMFQSRAGFSECLDRIAIFTSHVKISVSIPCWVF